MQDHIAVIDCIWNKDGPPWKCQQCDWIYARKGEPILSDKPPRRNCLKSPDMKLAAEKLGISWDDIQHYGRALARWTAAGFPVRSQSEVKRIHDDICVPCEHHVDGRCRKCGCGVNENRIAIWNKIKMESEHCREGKW
jgi:hypothetical protein